MSIEFNFFSVLRFYWQQNAVVKSKVGAQVARLCKLQLQRSSRIVFAHVAMDRISLKSASTQIVKRSSVCRILL